MINTLTVNSLHNISKTYGSGPLFCTLNDRQEYYCKKNNKSELPYTDLINEVLANRLLRGWGIETPDICLVNFDFETYKTEIEIEFNKVAQLAQGRNINLPNHYTIDKFSTPLFGSKVISPQMGLPGWAEKERFNLNEFENPIDLLLIGFFDLWIHNRDRKPTNSNIIYSKTNLGKFNLVAIDNCQAFNKSKNYVNLLANTGTLSKEESILASGFAQKIVDSASRTEIDILIENALTFARNSLTLIHEAFDEIPDSWGLNLSHKTEIANFLINDNRIQLISETFKSYLSYENLI